MRFMRSDTVKIGGKPVQVRKITITQWYELFAAAQSLPEILISVLTAPAGQKMAYFLALIERALDDFVQVTAVLTGLDSQWIKDNAGLDELVTYILAVAQANDFSAVLKNVQGVLDLVNPKVAEALAQSAE
ncbi:hypothetical protein D3C75_656590 [compost metagenome]